MVTKCCQESSRIASVDLTQFHFEKENLTIQLRFFEIGRIPIASCLDILERSADGRHDRVRLYSELDYRLQCIVRLVELAADLLVREEVQQFRVFCVDWLERVRDL